MLFNTSREMAWALSTPPHPRPATRVAYPYTYIRECPLCSDIIVIPVQTFPILMFPDFPLAVAFLASSFPESSPLSLEERRAVARS